MQLDVLLSDITDRPENAPKTEHYAALAKSLNAGSAVGQITPRGVEKWFERGSIPGKWLLRIAAVFPKINLANYS